MLPPLPHRVLAWSLWLLERVHSDIVGLPFGDPAGSCSISEGHQVRQRRIRADRTEHNKSGVSAAISLPNQAPARSSPAPGDSASSVLPTSDQAVVGLWLAQDVH